ncbi:helix-turn-helix domain-containing protein [Planomonospora algeriensis]
MLTVRKQSRQQCSRETVAAILEAAAQLFRRHGYGETTTNKIAERAGVSIGSLSIAERTPSRPGVEAQIHGALLVPATGDTAEALQAIVDLWHRALDYPLSDAVPP